MSVCRNEWWVPGKIVEAREQLQHFWRVNPINAPYAPLTAIHDLLHQPSSSAHYTESCKPGCLSFPHSIRMLI